MFNLSGINFWNGKGRFYEYKRTAQDFFGKSRDCQREKIDSAVMEKITLRGKEFIIRNLCENDYERPEKLLNYINGLIGDGSAMLFSTTEKSTIDEEKGWIKKTLLAMASFKVVMLVAELNNSIVGESVVMLCTERKEHVAELGISIIKDYRGFGLGKYLLQRIIGIAKNVLIPRPKMIRLSVFSTNKTAISLYQGVGFEIVASIPGQFEFDGRFVDEIVMVRFLH